MSKTKELASWQQDIATHAKEIAHNEGTDSSAITIQHGNMMYHDQPVANNELDVIVLSSVTEHCLYESAYDPDKIQSPDCFSQGVETTGLTPHENVPQPVHEDCDTCPYNQFGSALRQDGSPGKGKRCKEYRKIIFIPADTQPDDIPKAEMAYMKISPTSIKNWKKYVQQLVGSAGIPPWAATTKIQVVPDKKTIHQILFEGVAPLEDETLLSAIHARIPEAESKLLQPYTYEDEEESSKY
jgi:hypothetical protein